MQDKPKHTIPDEPDMLDALNASIRQLQQGIDTHCCLVDAIVRRQTDTHHLEALVRQCPKRSREAVLKDALKETIEVLEESRKAFKSKRLEVLRKRLTQILIETN